MIKIGLTGYLEDVVTETNVATSVGSGDVDVFATPKMIALMEKAAMLSIKSQLQEGRSSVGTHIDVKHLAATPIGLKVWSETEVIDVDNRKIKFSVKAYDEKGLIGEGTHERVIVDKNRFLKKAKEKLLLILLGILILTSCAGNNKIIEAVNEQMTLYPKSTLQDLYKAFYQAEFGPEHMISDTLTAGRYLDYELRVEDSSSVLYEPVGVDSSYFRVHLCAVQKGIISRDELFESFILSSRKCETDDIKAWAQKWQKIRRVIESMDLDIANYDSINGAVHHSQIFKDEYKPHYRIIRKDLFYERLFEKLNK